MPTDDQRMRSMTLMIDRLEKELRRSGRWQEQRIDPLATLAPGQVFAQTASSSFVDWLQFEFLPAARGALAEESLPSRTIAGLIALRPQGDPAGDPDVKNLVQLFDEFRRDLNTANDS